MAQKTGMRYEDAAVIVRFVRPAVSALLAGDYKSDCGPACATCIVLMLQEKMTLLTRVESLVAKDDGCV